MEFNEYLKFRKIFERVENPKFAEIVDTYNTYYKIENHIPIHGYKINGYKIYNFQLILILENELIEFDYNQFQKYYNLGYKYFEDNFKKVAPDVNHIEMLIYNFNNDWKRKLKMISYTFKEIITEFYFDNGLLDAYIEYEKNHKFLFEKIITTATAPEPKNKVEFLINEPQTATAPERQQNNNFTFENNFDEVKSDFVYNYFKENLVNKKYITIKVLEDFLVMAFQEKKQPENKFVFDKHTTKRNMINIFYHYYKVINQNSYGKQNEYVNLLCNYFIGYDAKKVGANFNK